MSDTGGKKDSKTLTDTGAKVKAALKVLA